MMENKAPTAAFIVSPAIGGLHTTFSVDASFSFDSEGGSALDVRWDWDDDGAWDTNWSTSVTAQHTYAFVGSHTIRLQVRDIGGLTDTTTRTVLVTAAEVPPEEFPWWVAALVVVNMLLTIVMFVLFALERRKMRPVEALAEGAGGERTGEPPQSPSQDGEKE